jgi:hypothetical protein
VADPQGVRADDMLEGTDSTSEGNGAWRPVSPWLPRLLIVGSALLSVISFVFLSTVPDFTFFAVNSEMNLATFVSVMLSVAAGGCHALVGRLVGGSVGKAFYVTAVVLIAMAFDDFAHIHERLNAVGDVLLPKLTHLYLWVVPALIPAAVVLLAFWHLGRRLNGSARRDLILGICILLGAALGLETINGFLDHYSATEGLPLLVLTHIEEFAENLGLILLLRGSLSMLRVSWRFGGVNLRLDQLAPERPGRPAA